MKNSGWKINYALRPAKSVERKLVCEIMRQINISFRLSDYRYIGFGASYFTDFILFHNELHIKNLVSLEKYEEKKERFEFNKPYGYITIKYGESSQVLDKQIEWDSETKDIIWLDYDSVLDVDKINDIELCINKIISGSVVLVSFNASIKGNEAGKRIPVVEEIFDKDKLPLKISEKDLDPIDIHKFFHNLLEISIEKALYEKNSKYVEKCDQYSYKQIMFFKYKDGAPMLTLGYIFYKNSDKGKIDNCNFELTEGYIGSNEPYVIDIPNFTAKEIQEINRHIPDVEQIQRSLEFLSETDIEKYLKIYRFFPHYRETSYIQ